MISRSLAAALCAGLLWSPCAFAQDHELNPGAVGVLNGERADGTLHLSAPHATEADDPSTADKLKGRLLVLKDKAVKDALHSGVSLDESLSLSEFLHLGVELKTYVLKDSRLVPEQIEQLERTPNHAWIATEVEGGIRLPFVTTIPLSEVANVRVGTTPSASLRYHVADLYEIPEGVADVEAVVDGLKALGKRAFTLPLSADEALEQPMGALRIVSGNLSVAVNGALGVGYDLADLGDVVQLGASARVGGFYVFRDTLEIRTTRLDGDAIRLRLRDGRSHERGGTAALLIGASVDRNALRDEFIPSVEYVEPLVDMALNEVRGQIKDVLRFRLSGDAGKLRGTELDLSFRFDLSVRSAREAYERAVRGDLTVAGALARVPDSGVLEEFRVIDVEDRTYRSGELTISVIASAGFEKRMSVKDLVVNDETGANRYEVFRFDRRRRASFFGRTWDRKLHVEVIGRAPDDDSTALAERSFRFRYTIKDGRTRLGEVRELKRAIALWNLPGTDAASLPTPSRRLFRSRYGQTEASLAVDVSERGLEAILASSPAAFGEAYLAACAAIDGEAPGWRDRRASLRFSEALAGLANASSREDRAETITRLAEGSDWDLYTVTAIVSLAPPESLRLNAAILGTRVSFSNGLTGSQFVDRSPELYGH